MKKFSVLSLAFCALVLSLLVTSCSKESVDEMEEIVEVNYQMEVTLRGTTTTYDAFAAYCNENGIESFSVSNNAGLLGNDVWASNAAEGDFVVHYRKDATSEFSLGGTIIETTLNGQTIKNFTLTDDSLVDITISTANDTEVLGSLSGDFLVLVDPINEVFDTIPFSVSFAAEVDPVVVPIFCQ